VTETWVDDRQIALDGGTWAVRQAGAPDGLPLVYFHGTPSCRLEPSFADDLAAELGVRVVSFDRPGYGRSTPAPFSLSSVARATAVILDELGIDTFAVTGQSGGGPFSLACAAVLGERVTHAGVNSGPAPFDQVPELMAMLDENDSEAVALLPDEEAAAAKFGQGFEPFRALGRMSPAEIIGGYRQMCSTRDNALLDDPRNARVLAEGLAVALVQGTSGGGWDNVAWVGPWDFDLADVRAPVDLWYGGEDKFCPAPVGPWLEEHLPDATLHFRPGDGHLGVMDHTREVLETLMASRQRST
jgi:pimeloyl-ACP methyl ester carboxylesterase